MLQPYYDSLYELFSQDWKVEFAKTDCWDSARKAELTVQANAVHKQPLTAGIVNGSAKPRAFALSLSGPMFHGDSDTDPSFWSRTQAATMFRITTDFWGSWEQVEQPGGGTLARIGMLANDSLIGANGTFPDLDMLPMGQIRCSGPAAIVQHPACRCDNCAGTGEAFTLASLWAIARSPLLFGGDLPADAQTQAILTNANFLEVHARARNQTVIEFRQANETRGAAARAGMWVRWVADLAPPPPSSRQHPGAKARGGYGGLGLARRRTATSTSSALKVVLAINVGAAADTTQTTWAELGLPGEGSYTATDIWTGQVAPADGAGFHTHLAARNATLLLIHAAASPPDSARARRGPDGRQQRPLLAQQFAAVMRTADGYSASAPDGDGCVAARALHPAVATSRVWWDGRTKRMATTNGQLLRKVLKNTTVVDRLDLVPAVSLEIEVRASPAAAVLARSGRHCVTCCPRLRSRSSTRPCATRCRSLPPAPAILRTIRACRALRPSHPLSRTRTTTNATSTRPTWTRTRAASAGSGLQSR